MKALKKYNPYYLPPLQQLVKEHLYSSSTRMVLALNNPQSLICYLSNKPNQKYLSESLFFKRERSYINTYAYDHTSIKKHLCILLHHFYLFLLQKRWKICNHCKQYRTIATPFQLFTALHSPSQLRLLLLLSLQRI